MAVAREAARAREVARVEASLRQAEEEAAVEVAAAAAQAERELSEQQVIAQQPQVQSGGRQVRRDSKTDSDTDSDEDQGRIVRRAGAFGKGRGRSGPIASKSRPDRGEEAEEGQPAGPAMYGMAAGGARWVGRCELYTPVPFTFGLVLLAFWLTIGVMWHFLIREEVLKASRCDFCSCCSICFSCFSLHFPALQPHLPSAYFQSLTFISHFSRVACAQSRCEMAGRRSERAGGWVGDLSAVLSAGIEAVDVRVVACGREDS